MPACRAAVILAPRGISAAPRPALISGDLASFCAFQVPVWRPKSLHADRLNCSMSRYPNPFDPEHRRNHGSCERVVETSWRKPRGQESHLGIARMVFTVHLGIRLSFRCTGPPRQGSGCALCEPSMFPPANRDHDPPLIERRQRCPYRRKRRLIFSAIP